MDKSSITQLYGAQYAESYDDKYLMSTIHRSDTAFEVATLASLLSERASWLDVACGTGYFLAQFPAHARAGCDISPAMMAKARAANPSIVIHEHSFLDPNPAWVGKWDLVSCMWYAYCYVDCMDKVWRVFDHLAEWTAPGGTCFVPYCDLNLIFRTLLPTHELATLDPGKVYLDGLVWSYKEDSGEHHRQLYAPHPELIAAYMAKYFSDVETIQYPPAMPGWSVGRYALAARNRKPAVSP